MYKRQGNTNGVLKSVVNAKNGKILGCTLFCSDSGEVINNVALVMKAGLDYSSLRDQIYTHPSMSAVSYTHLEYRTLSLRSSCCRKSESGTDNSIRFFINCKVRLNV